MNYWHMQLEPGNKNLGYRKVKEILLKNIIGMGTWDEKSNQQNDFKYKMKVGDIVLIKSGKTVIGLVKVTSNYFEKDDDEFWFNQRRGVQILEILDPPKRDFPQPRGTLKLASDRNTPTYKYIDEWYQRIKRKQDNFQLKDIMQLHKDFTTMKSGKEYLFKKINSIDKSDIRQLSYIYEADYPNIENKPVVYLRKKIIEYLKENSIDEDVIKDFKNNIKMNFSTDVFRIWNDPFRILYTIYFAKYKDKLEEYLKRFIEIIQKRLKIKHITKYNFVHFDGPQNQGNDHIWFAIYNSTYKSQRHAYQLFMQIKDEKFQYGLLHMDKKIRNLDDMDELCFKDLISKFKKHVDVIIKDNSKERAMITENIELLEFQKQIILQGPPGTGKTRLAKQMALSLCGHAGVIDSNDEIKKAFDAFEKEGRVKLIQFHPSYSYEDFVRGIVAETTEKGIEYKAVDKTLAKMAKDAKDNSNEKYVLIIDEINRANLSSVLGELIYVLEYRGEVVESMYEVDGTKSLTLPKNLYIIGTMNTADRSVGHIDYAIRRRFTFVDVLANENDVLNQYPKGKKLFKIIESVFTSEYVSPEFMIEDVKIGHSYFIEPDKNGDEDIETLAKKFVYQVVPLLYEYVKDGVFFKPVPIEFGKKQFLIDPNQQKSIDTSVVTEFLKQ